MSKLDKEFRLVLSRISDRLSSEDVKSIVFMIGHENTPIPRQDLDAITSGEGAFDLMMKHGMLGKVNTDDLMQILEDKNLKPCVEMLQKFKDKNKEDLMKSKEGPCNMHDDVIVEHFKETEKLEELQQKLQMSKSVTLSGFLGCGKTQLALKYACMFRTEHKNGICWKIVCQSNVTLLNSLKRLADELGIAETKQMESCGSKESLQFFTDVIPTAISDNTDNLIVMDDVTEETKLACEKLKRSFTMLNIKIIVTTCDFTLSEENDSIVLSGFTEQEAVEFLKAGKESSPDDDKGYHELARHLSCLPLLLYGARTCMRSSRQSPKRFTKYLKGTSSPTNIAKFVRSPSEPSENKELFKILKTYLQRLQEQENDDVFDMVLVLQFLGVEDIPILLFDFLPTKMDTSNRGSNTTHFIQAIHKFSFAMLRGEDDARLINTHFAVVKTIDNFTTVEEKKRLIRKLLVALIWLMDKDNFETKDYDRNDNLLPHAISVLQHVKVLQNRLPNLQEDFEFNVLLAYVYDVVGYTYNFFGILKNAGQHSTEAKEACFRIIGISEKDIEEKVSQTNKRSDNHIECETFANSEATLIFGKLQEKCRDSRNTKILNDMAKQFLLNKYRGQGQIQLLQRLLGDNLEDEYILTEKEYRFLQDKNLAIPEDELGQLFLFELVVQVFYTFGRRIFYLGSGYDKQTARTFAHSLFLAESLGKKISHSYTKCDILYIMLTELSGTLEQIFDDKADLNLKSLENLEHAANRIKVLLEVRSNQFSFGLIKSEPDSPQHKHICYKRLVRCYTSMAEIAKHSHDAKRQKIHDNGLIYFEKLKENQSTCREFNSANLRMAEFQKQLGYYEEAENKFMVVAPEDMIVETEQMKTTVLKHLELEALKGLIKCYAESGKVEQANSLAKRVQQRLHVTKENKELEYFKQMIIELGLANLKFVDYYENSV